MRISDWSSDVCSSDLPGHRAHNPPAALRCPAATDQQRNSTMLDRSDPPIRLYAILTVPGLENSGPAHWQSLWEDSDPACTRVEIGRSEERRVGKECVRTCRARVEPDH